MTYSYFYIDIILDSPRSNAGFIQGNLNISEGYFYSFYFLFFFCHYSLRQASPEGVQFVKLG